MGRIIGIGDRIGSLDFRLRFTVTGEEQTVSVDEQMQHLFLEQDITRIRPVACPFLRRIAPERFACSIHATRPYICRQYACFRIRVLDRNGQQAGKVSDGSRYCQTADPGLRRIWKDRIEGKDLPDREWEDFVRSVLGTEGYLVEG
jgi:hypothetical protein